MNSCWLVFKPIVSKLGEIINLHWKDLTYEDLLEQASHVTGQSERRQIYQQADSVLTKEDVILEPPA